MGQLVELVFESVARTTAAALLQDLTRSSDGIKDINVDGKAMQARMHVEQLASSVGFCATVRLIGFDIPQVGVIPSVALRMMKTGSDCFDVEFNLDIDDVPNVVHLASGLHRLASDFAKRHSVSDYFAGLEPAADEDTRLFTGEALGPFHFPAE